MKKKRNAPAQNDFPPIRFGLGYDIHKLVAGRTLMLGGVRIPSEKGLLGHSDADALLHAICDALLGAAALGDIGVHFPDTDETFRGISSLKLLSHVSRLLDVNGYAVGNIDSTVILQKPKMMKYAVTMRRRIARVLHISPDQVSIKATTQEGLGSLGRAEGCAAFAVASLLRKTR